MQEELASVSTKGPMKRSGDPAQEKEALRLDQVNFAIIDLRDPNQDDRSSRSLPSPQPMPSDQGGYPEDEPQQESNPLNNQLLPYPQRA